WSTALYFIVVVLGFYTTEAFLFVPLTLGLDAAVRGDRQQAILNLAFVLFLTCVYFMTLRDFHHNLDGTRSLLAVAHNFLMLLSGHFAFLCIALGAVPDTASKVSILVSVLQLVCFGLFVARSYKLPVRMKPFVRFSISLGIFGIGSIGLATWLRFAEEMIYYPVNRYTAYSVAFSVGLFLLGSSAQFRKTGTIYFIFSFSVIVTNVGYIFAEVSVMAFRDHNIGQDLTRLRLEMPVYALAPGDELNIG